MKSNEVNTLVAESVFGKSVANGYFPLRDAPAGNHGSCIRHLGLDICFDDYNYHDSLQASLENCLFMIVV